MGTISANGRSARLSASAATAMAAGAAAALAAGCALLAWRFLPGLVVPLLLAAPPAVAAAAWLAAREAIRAALRPAVQALDRIDRQDFANANLPAGEAATEELLRALARCGEALAARQATARAHAVVAKLMGAGVGRLAMGDCDARIEVELPPPYDGFGRDFNAAAAALAAKRREAADLRGRVEGHAAALAEAAARLGTRAERLAMRIDTDLRIIDALARREPAEALAIARHTMEGVGVASRRNREAAETLLALGRALREAAPPAGAAAPSAPPQPDAGLAA